MSDLPFDLNKDARILIVDDTPANLRVLYEALETAGYQVQVATNGEEALAVAEAASPDVVLLDVVMPGLDGFETCRRLKAQPAMREIPVIFITARTAPDEIVEGFAAGGVDYVLKPANPEEVLARVRTHLERARLIQALQEEIRRGDRLTNERDHLVEKVSLLAQQEEERWNLYGIIGQSRMLKTILEDIRRLQHASTTVLITGESGTGKELIARAIHAGGEQSGEPFIPVNCAAIPEHLAESLLFGHQRGSFSGAVQDQRGYFMLADPGTLFLDEISEMPLPIQAKLLRVLETGMIMPLGAREETRVNVRVLASSNKDLEKNIEKGLFREDLYYRLATYTVVASPLRERRDDIPLLSQHFLTLLAQEMNRPVPILSAAAREQLSRYDFPGNVRELKNIMERALLLCTGSEILPEHLYPGSSISSTGETSTATQDIAAPASAPGIDLPYNLAEAETALVRRALDHTDGNVAAAARLLGVARNKVYRVIGKASK